MKEFTSFFTLFYSVVLSVLLTSCTSVKQESKIINLTVYASASLKSALADIQKIYQQDRPTINIKYKLAGSGTLAKSIERGDRVDIAIVSYSQILDNLQSQNLLLTETHQNLLKNQIVLIVSQDVQNISDFKDLTQTQIQKIALGNRTQEISGKYSLEILSNLGILNQIKHKFVLMSKNSEILSFVENGKSRAGLLYATDAILSEKVKIVMLSPQKLHSPIIYPVAVFKTSSHPTEAKSFIQFLKTERAKAVFLKYRFIVNSNYSNLQEKK
jgi:molybdate transport system substrate-binding protein